MMRSAWRMTLSATLLATLPATLLATLLACGCSGGAKTADGAPVTDGGARDSGGGLDGGGSGACATTGAEIPMLAACATDQAVAMVEAKLGCGPVVDGILHAEEWSDASCFNVPGDLVVEIKYAVDSVYIAASGHPTCGCPMTFYFDPDGNVTTDGDEFAILVFDDPMGKDGDRSDLTFQNGKFAAGMAPPGIVTRCPGMMPDPVRYEIQIPYVALGLVAGLPHTFRMAIVHAMAKWPKGLTTNMTTDRPDDPSTWAKVTSTHGWR